MSRPTKFSFRFFCILVFFSSCGGTNRISNRDLSYLYKSAYTLLHPQYVLYNFSKDSTRLYAKINTKELLYKKDPDHPFTASCRLEITLYADFEAKEPAGNYFILFDDVQTDDSLRYLVKTLDFPAKDNADYVAEIKLTDLHRAHFEPPIPSSVNQLRNRLRIF